MRHEGIGSEAGGFHSSARPPSVWTGCFRPWADPAPGPAPGASHPALTGMVPVPAVLADDFIRIRPCLGVLVPEQNCESTPRAYVNFERENAHYVSRLLVNWEDDVQELSLSDPRSRGYRATIEVDTTIDWIKSQPADQPWMATLSFSSAHTPQIGRASCRERVYI